MTANPLKIGFEPNLPPLSREINGEPGGLAIAMVTAICNQADLRIQFTPIKLEQQQAALNTGDIDAIAFVGKSAEGERKFEYSDAYLETGAAWFSLREQPWKDSDAEIRPRIATPAAGPLVGRVKRRYPEATVVEVENYPDALEAVITDLADVAALNFQIGADVAQRIYPDLFLLPSAPFEVMDGVMAVPQGDPGGILGQLNLGISRAKSNGLLSEIENSERR